VAPNGNDAAAGTERAPFRSMDKALSLLQPGEAVFLKAGTYTERLRLDDRDGTPGRYLTVKAAPGAKPVIRGGTGSSSPLLDVRRAYWRVEGLTFDVAGDRVFAAFWRGAGAHHGILRGCTLKNGTAGAGVSIAERASDVLIEKNTIYNFQRPSDDSHGVVVETTARNVIVRGNDIHHNSGDAVQCLGPEGGATLAGTPFDNLLVEDNELHENRENGADIKTCTRVTLRNNRIWGHRRSTTSAGEGVVVHLSARDVILEDNVLRDNGRGIIIGGVRQGPPPTNIIVRRNLVLAGRDSDGTGTGIRVDTSTNVKVHHNTVWNMPTYGLVVGNGDSGLSQNVEVRNNLLGACAVAVRIGSTREAVSFDGNLYFSPQGAATFRIDGGNLDFSQWRRATRWDARSVEKAPAFVDLEQGDFRLGPSSPARNAGLSLGQTFCGTAPDIGARESDCP
jgi:nitrous oxidase accessory protein NosD